MAVARAFSPLDGGLDDARRPRGRYIMPEDYMESWILVLSQSDPASPPAAVCPESGTRRARLVCASPTPSNAHACPLTLPGLLGGRRLTVSAPMRSPGWLLIVKKVVKGGYAVRPEHPRWGGRPLSCTQTRPPDPIYVSWLQGSLFSKIHGSDPCEKPLVFC